MLLVVVKQSPKAIGKSSLRVKQALSTTEAQLVHNPTRIEHTFNTIHAKLFTPIVLNNPLMYK
jgi:hypothetical protein